MNRVSDTITFGFPTRDQFRSWANHLSDDGLEKLARESQGLMPKDIYRAVLSTLLEFSAKHFDDHHFTLPKLRHYLEGIDYRQKLISSLKRK